MKTWLKMVPLVFPLILWITGDGGEIALKEANKVLLRDSRDVILLSI